MKKLIYYILIFFLIFIINGVNAMAVSLDYNSTSSVSDDLEGKIQSEVKVINNNFDWWCEPIAFFTDPQGRDKLTGSTKLFLIGYSSDGGEYVEVDPDEDSYLAHRDASFIIENIVKWSKKYNINWKISVAGTEIGQIKNGRVDDQIREFLKLMSRRSVDNPFDRQTLENKILEKHKDR